MGKISPEDNLNYYRYKAQLKLLETEFSMMHDIYKKADLAGEIAIIRLKMKNISVPFSKSGPKWPARKPKNTYPKSDSEMKANSADLQDPSDARAAGPSTKVIDKFVLDINKYNSLFEIAIKSDDSQKRGKALEDMAGLLFDSCGDLFSVHPKGIRTSTHQIDRVVLVKDQSFVSDFGRFIIIECKNWAKTINSATVDKLNSNILSAKMKTGVLFTMGGISKDAKITIRNFNQRANTINLVFDREDLKAIQEGENFIRLLWNRYFREVFST